MTMFERLAFELIGTVEESEGIFEGKTAALYKISVGIICSDDEDVFNLPLEKQIEMIKREFYKIFPYMK